MTQHIKAVLIKTNDLPKGTQEKMLEWPKNSTKLAVIGDGKNNLPKFTEITKGIQDATLILGTGSVYYVAANCQKNTNKLILNDEPTGKNLTKALAWLIIQTLKGKQCPYGIVNCFTGQAFAVSMGLVAILKKTGKLKDIKDINDLAKINKHELFKKHPEFFPMIRVKKAQVGLLNTKIIPSKHNPFKKDTKFIYAFTQAIHMKTMEKIIKILNKISINKDHIFEIAAYREIELKGFETPQKVVSVMIFAKKFFALQGHSDYATPKDMAERIQRLMKGGLDLDDYFKFKKGKTLKIVDQLIAAENDPHGGGILRNYIYKKAEIIKPSIQKTYKPKTQ